MANKQTRKLYTLKCQLLKKKSKFFSFIFFSSYQKQQLNDIFSPGTWGTREGLWVPLLSLGLISLLAPLGMILLAGELGPPGPSSEVLSTPHPHMKSSREWGVFLSLASKCPRVLKMNWLGPLLSLGPRQFILRVLGLAKAQWEGKHWFHFTGERVWGQERRGPLTGRNTQSPQWAPKCFLLSLSNTDLVWESVNPAA